MANWVTLPNGVHIDLDDPNNPLTGDGSFESYLGGGGSSGSGKNSAKAKIDTTVPDVTSKTVSEAKNNFKARVEKLSPKERDYANEQLKGFLGNHADEIDAYDHISTLIDNGSVSYFANKSSKQNAPKQDDGFMEWYNSLSEQDRASIDRQMHADKEVGAKYGFTPTKQTIWNDKNHPLYGIAPSEQDEDYLNSAIAEMSRYSNRWSTMSKREKNEISPNGKAALDKRIKQYSKALDYIKSFK